MLQYSSSPGPRPPMDVEVEGEDADVKVMVEMAESTSTRIHSGGTVGGSVVGSPPPAPEGPPFPPAAADGAEGAEEAVAPPPLARGPGGGCFRGWVKRLVSPSGISTSSCKGGGGLPNMSEMSENGPVQT